MAITPTERLQCNDSALFCFGTAYIFECRAFPLRIANRLLLFSSLAGPLAIGALVLALGTKGHLISWALWVAAILSVGQVIISLWAVVAEWQQRLTSYEESIVENHFLAGEFKDLANDTTLIDSKWRARLDSLDARGDIQRRSDLKKGITEEERRMGMRYSLRYYSRPCPSCGEVPQSIASSDCPICGQFKQRNLKWLI